MKTGIIPITSKDAPKFRLKGKKRLIAKGKLQGSKKSPVLWDKEPREVLLSPEFRLTLVD
jgi:hypothetical protein